MQLEIPTQPPSPEIRKAHDQSPGSDPGQNPSPKRTPIPSEWPEWVALLCYTALVAFAIPWHEPWADEAQAWQLARNLSLSNLFRTYLRYEGSPGLWHLMLWIAGRAHVTYSGVHWICGGIAVIAASLLLFKSPFPRYLRLTLPFTYFLLFQYAVVARNYVLVPPLIFAIAFCWKKKPVLVALLLGLLANVALHAAAISGGLAIAYAIEQIRRGNLKRPDLRRDLLVAVFVLLAFYIFALWTVWPPPGVVSHERGTSHSFLSWAVGSVLLGMCYPWLLSIPFWFAIAACLAARRRFFYLIPVLFFAIFSGAVHVAFWHMGLLVPLVIGFLWITWPAHDSPISRAEIAGRVALVVMAAGQILWSAYAVTYDHFHPFSPDLAAAKFLRPFVNNGDSIAVTFLDTSPNHPLSNDPQADTFLSVGIQAYFDHPIFANQPQPFWPWNDESSVDRSFQTILPSHPRFVIVEIVQNSPGAIVMQGARMDRLKENGYRLTNVFCGTMPIRLKLNTTYCHTIFQHSAAADSTLTTAAVSSNKDHQLAF